MITTRSNPDGSSKSKSEPLTTSTFARSEQRAAMAWARIDSPSRAVTSAPRSPR